MAAPIPQLHRLAAADGWPLTLHHYPPSGTNPHGEPVLLQHGLGTCSRQFDLRIKGGASYAPSLSRWLSALGYSVWSSDLRGGGDSSKPGSSGLARWGWSVDDHIHGDVPAFLDYILRQSRHERLHWVGHSMGGILLLTHCVAHGSEQIASGVAAASGFDYSMSGSRYDLIEPLKKLGRLVRWVPAGQMSSLIAPFAGRVNNPFEASFYNPRNISPVAARAILKDAQYDVSGEVLHQLASLFKPGGLRSADGGLQYSDGAARVDVPILFIAGERDLQCSPTVVRHNYELLAGDQHEFQEFGKSHGHVEHYGHFDLMAGLRANEEVFPQVLRWLQAHPIA